MIFPFLPDLGPRPPLGYVERPLDRAAHLRRDAAPLLEADAARAYLIGGEHVAMRRSGVLSDPLFPLAEARRWSAAEPLFLGLDGAAPRFAIPFDPALREAMEADGLKLPDLRSAAAGGFLASEHLSALACGKALAGWHARHRFCSNCGAPTRAIEAGWRRDCPSCGAQHFPRTDPVAIMLVSLGERCLLGRQPHFPPGMWSCLAGFVEPGETFEDAVRRETLEEAGIATSRVTYQACQPWPFPMSLMIGCRAEATSADIVVDHAELEDARWFAVDEVAHMLAKTHPAGLFVPPPVAIAHHLVRAFVEGPRG